MAKQTNKQMFFQHMNSLLAPISFLPLTTKFLQGAVHVHFCHCLIPRPHSPVYPSTHDTWTPAASPFCAPWKGSTSPRSPAVLWQPVETPPSLLGLLCCCPWHFWTTPPHWNLYFLFFLLPVAASSLSHLRLLFLILVLLPPPSGQSHCAHGYPPAWTFPQLQPHMLYWTTS